MFDQPEFAKSSSKIILAARFRGNQFPALAFLQDQPREDQIKVLALLRRAADNWPIRNREKCKKIEGELFEFKIHQIRLPWFQRSNLVVITHGFRKKQDKIPQEEIDRAFSVLSYFDEHYEVASGRYKGEKR